MPVIDAASQVASKAGSVSNRPVWRDSMTPYERPSWGRSLLDLATSAVPYVALSVLMYVSLGEVTYWATFALAIPTAGFLLRTFIVFHDCTHGSFLPSRRANLWVGRLSGLLVFQPFANWRHTHAVHHGTAGDLDRRGTGDIPTLTFDEYVASPWRKRLGYRLFRNPLVMFGIGPLWSLMFGPRLWSRSMRPRQRRSVVITNLFLAVLLGAICWLVGWQEWLLVQMPSAILAGTAGVWLFYVQHQFEDVYWESGESWGYADAALRGSSYLKLPQLVRPAPSLLLAGVRATGSQTACGHHPRRTSRRDWGAAEKGTPAQRPQTDQPRKPKKITTDTATISRWFSEYSGT